MAEKLKCYHKRLIQDADDKPLVLVLSWLQAKQKHLKKYAKIYMDQGFDVLVARITPWQLLWPAKGTQVKFLIIIIRLDYKVHSLFNRILIFLASCWRHCGIPRS